jgi:hypothetical protein
LPRAACNADPPQNQRYTHEHVEVHGDIVEGGGAELVENTAGGVFGSPCTQEVTNETFESIHKLRAASGAKLPNAPAAILLPISGFTKHLVDQFVSRSRSAPTEQGRIAVFFFTALRCNQAGDLGSRFGERGLLRVHVRALKISNGHHHRHSNGNSKETQGCLLHQNIVMHR